jgi:hypothetical protein
MTQLSHERCKGHGPKTLLLQQRTQKQSNKAWPTTSLLPPVPTPGPESRPRDGGGRAARAARPRRARAQAGGTLTPTAWLLRRRRRRMEHLHLAVRSSSSPRPATELRAPARCGPFTPTSSDPATSPARASSRRDAFLRHLASAAAGEPHHERGAAPIRRAQRLLRLPSGPARSACSASTRPVHQGQRLRSCCHG